MIKVFFAPGTGFDINILIMFFLSFSIVKLGEFFEGSMLYFSGIFGLFIHDFFSID